MKPRLRRTPLICLVCVLSCYFFLEAHIHANELLVDAGREVAFFFRDMLELGNYYKYKRKFNWTQNYYVIYSVAAIEGVTQILETEVQEAPDDEYGVAKLIQEKIVQVNHAKKIKILHYFIIMQGLP